MSSPFSVLDRHRQDLAGEEAVVGARRGALVRLQRERVHLLAGDAPLVGEHLRDPELDAERVVGVGEELGRLNGPAPPRAFDDIGARVIDSTPHAIARSYAPAITPCATKCAACCDEPHWRSTLVAGTCHGSPAATHALRVTLQPCSPAWVTQPPTTSSTQRGIDVVALDQRAQREAEQVGRVPAGERALALADRGARGVDDDGFHGPVP